LYSIHSAYFKQTKTWNNNLKVIKTCFIGTYERLVLPTTNSSAPNVPTDDTIDYVTKRLALDQLVDTKSWTKGFKIHAAIAAAISVLSFGSKLRFAIQKSNLP
jgi:hypothetical protein